MRATAGVAVPARKLVVRDGNKVSDSAALSHGDALKQSEQRLTDFGSILQSNLFSPAVENALEVQAICVRAKGASGTFGIFE